MSDDVSLVLAIPRKMQRAMKNAAAAEAVPWKEWAFDSLVEALSNADMPCRVVIPMSLKNIAKIKQAAEAAHLPAATWCRRQLEAMVDSPDLVDAVEPEEGEDSAMLIFALPFDVMDRVEDRAQCQISFVRDWCSGVLAAAAVAATSTPAAP